jgi:predicted permease
MNNVTFAVRQMRRAPGFTAVAVATLALGIGATTTVFSVVNAVLLRPLPWEAPARLVALWEAPGPGRRNNVSAGVFADWRRESRSFEDVAAFAPTGVNLVGVGPPERVRAMRISASGFQVLRARPLLGRTFAPGEDQPGAEKVVVLAEGLWRRRFGADRSVIGTGVQLSGVPHTVIGVVPASALPIEDAELAVPFELPREPPRSNHFLHVVGRLRPGVEPGQAQAELATIVDRIRPLYPLFKREWGVAVVPLHEQVTGDVRPTLLVLLGAVGLVLLVACANVANLLLARATARAQEIAVRLALGASRARVVGQLLVESLVLSLTGGVLGVGLAFGGVAVLRQAAPEGVPRIQEVTVDLRVLAFAVAAAVATGLLFGLAPALRASRPDLGGTLKGSGRGVAGGRTRVQSTLVAAEVAVALVLLAGAGLLVNSFARLTAVAAGFDPEGALAFQLALPDAKYPDPATRSAAVSAVVTRMAAVPGVEAAAASTTLPLATWPMDNLVRIDGERDGPPAGRNADFEYCTPEWFRVMGIPLLRGRGFDERDTAASARVAVVNDTFARTYLGGDALGRRFTEGTETWEVVGVVGDVHARSLDRDVRPAYYRPAALGRSGNVHVVLRTKAPAAQLAEAIRAAVLEVDAEQPIANLRSLDTVVSASVAPRRFVLRVLALFTGAALALAALGLYGLIAYSVAQREREIGVRMAVGATGGAVVRLVLRQGGLLVGVGVASGVAGALAVTRVLGSQLYGVTPRDPATLAVVAAVLVATALLACWLPARRAARVDPARALR